MENASKALIIAGAILLSILIIALGMTVYNSSSSVTEGMDMTSQEIGAHNSKFLTYQGKQKGSQVIRLLTDIQSNNEQYSDRKISILLTNSAAPPTFQADYKGTYALHDSIVSYVRMGFHNISKIDATFNENKDDYNDWLDDKRKENNENNYYIKSTTTYRVKFDYADNGLIWVCYISK